MRCWAGSSAVAVTETGVVTALSVSLRAHAAMFLPTLVAVALVGPISNGMIARFIEGRQS